MEEAVAQKLGEEFMVLVPEAIPFLAELMEGKFLQLFPVST